MDRTGRMVAFINVAHFIDHFFLLIFPTAVLGMAVSFDLSYGELLALATGSFIAFGAGSLPAGWLGDRWSRRNMMVVFLLGIGAAAILTGFSVSPAMLAVCLTLVGLFSAIYHPIGGAMLAANAGDRLGRRMGLNGVFGNLGVAGAALITGALTQYLGWRWAFFVPGLVAMAVGVAFWVMVPDGAGVGAKKGGKPAATIPRELVLRVFAVLGLVIMTGGVIFQAATVSLPKLFDERVTSIAGSAAGVGALAAAIFTVGAMAQLTVGQTIDRFGLKGAFMAVSAFAAPALLGAAYATDWLMLVCAGGIMVAIFGQVTINDTMLARYTTDEWRARVFAIRYFLGFATAGAAVPLVSILHERAGFSTLYVVLAALGACVFLGSLLFPREYSHRQAAPAAAE